MAGSNGRPPGPIGILSDPTSIFGAASPPAQGDVGGVPGPIGILSDPTNILGAASPPAQGDVGDVPQHNPTGSYEYSDFGDRMRAYAGRNPHDDFSYLSDVAGHHMRETGGRDSIIDPGQYQFNGDPYFARDYAGTMYGAAKLAANRGAPEYDPDLAGYNVAALQGQEARAGQILGLTALTGDVGYLRDVARGTAGPSAAQLAMQGQAEDAFRQQLAQAAGARGANVAGAQANAAWNNAMTQGQLTRDLGVQRANEQLAAQELLLRGNEAVLRGADAVRGRDIETAGMAADTAFHEADTRAEVEMRTREQNDALVQFFLSQGLSIMEAQLRANIIMDQTRTGNYIALETGRPQETSAWDNILPAAIQGGATIAGAAIGTFAAPGAGTVAGAGAGAATGRALTSSDIRAKEDLRDASAETEDFLRRLGELNETEYASTSAVPDFEQVSATRYRYKDPKRHGYGEYVGPMAQELEQDPVGKTVVVNQPDGTKGIDTSRLSLLNTSALGDHRRELDALQAQVNRQNELMATMMPPMPPAQAPVPANLGGAAALPPVPQPAALPPTAPPIMPGPGPLPALTPPPAMGPARSPYDTLTPALRFP